MKTKILTSILLGMLTLAFIYINPSSPAEDILLTPPPQNNNISGRFLIGAMNNALDWDFRYTDELHFNLWHYYTDGEEISGRHYPRGWWWFTGANDKLFDDINTYETPVTNQLDNIYSNNRMQSFIMRPKIEYLLYGQRSDYQCEDVSMVNPDLWFYTFQSPDHKGVDIIDGSDTVRHCRLGTDNAGMVVSRLRANTEQSRYSDAQGGNWWQSDSECDWLIKPRIRIDSNFAHNNLQTPVCSIKVIAQDGQTVLKNTIIKGINFIDAQGNYDGRYLEEFYNFQSSADSLKIHGSWGDKWDFKARGNRETDTDNNKADIQVYWYGNCDMWIDYVRVDNDIADGLLGSGNPSYGMYDQWLMDAATSGYINIFAINPAEFELNNLPCLKYVEKKLKEYSNGRFKIVAVR